MKLRVFFASFCLVTVFVVLITHLSYRSDGSATTTRSENSTPSRSRSNRNLYTSQSVNSTRPAGHTPSKLVALHWTSVYGNKEDNSYHFFSAYYDGRASSELRRPAVIVMGYVYNKVKSVDIYCKFTYQDGSTVCRGGVAPQRHVSPCFGPNLGAKAYHYICGVKAEEEVPGGVQMSTSSSCDPRATSALIPVQTRNSSINDKPPKKFGICIGGPLVKESDHVLNDVIEYAEMAKVLGVDQVVFYVNEAQVDTAMLEYLWKHYSDIVHTVSWKKFEKWTPHHYRGQLLIISDCFYRYMYEVEHIAVIDLDEMIIPIKHSTWGDMITGLAAKEDVSSYTFQNNFFTLPKDHKEPVIDNCSNRIVPKYFTRTDSHECYPGHGYRPKVMYVARHVYEPNIHWPCQRVAGYGGNINVPPEMALLGHFRTEVPDDCKALPIHTDETVGRFRSQVIDSLCNKQPP